MSRQGEDALWQLVFAAQPARGLNAKTVAKWRKKRGSAADLPIGPSRPKSTVLSEIEEAIVVEFRRLTLLPLDDVLGCLHGPSITRPAAA